MTEKNIEYNKTKEFKENVEPILKQLLEQCSIHGIPFFATFAVENRKDETKYISEMHSAVTNDIPLANDMIVKMANVLNGFDVVLNDNVIELEL